MTPIYPLNDREDLGNLMASASSRHVTPVEIAKVRLCRPSVYDRSVQVCIHMQISVYDHVLRMNRQVSCMCDFLSVYIYKRQLPSCQAIPVVPRLPTAIDIDADDSPVRHIAAVQPPIDLSPPPKKRPRIVMDVSP